MINWNIVGNPVNWVIVTMTLIFVAYAMFVIHQNMSSLLPSLPVAPNLI